MASSLPFTFEQTDASLELTVRVAVPPSTQREDVAVRATAEHLRVSIARHGGPAAVLDGEFFYDVDFETLDWALMGEGANRRLVISLDKAEPVDWSEGLLRHQTAPEAPPPELPRNLSAAAAPAAAPAPPAAALPSPTQAILLDLMSGKKNLLTRDGVVSGVEVARALGAVMPETQQSHAKSTAGGGVDAAGRRERLKEYILSQYKDRLPG